MQVHLIFLINDQVKFTLYTSEAKGKPHPALCIPQNLLLDGHLIAVQVYLNEP